MSGEDNLALSTADPLPTPQLPAAGPSWSVPLHGLNAAPLPSGTALKLLAAKPVLELVSGLTPAFPKALLRRFGAGSVVVSFGILPDGSIGATSVVTTSHPGLKRATQAAVAGRRSKPISEPVDGVTELRFE